MLPVWFKRKANKGHSMMEYKLDKKKFNSELFRISVPIAIQNLMLALVAAADAFMLGQVGQNEMTAVSLATQIQFIENMFFYAIVCAGSVLGAQYWGKNDKKTVSDIFSIMIKYSVIVSIGFFLACEFAPEYLMKVFTSDPVLIDIGSNYLRIAGWSYLLTGICECYLTIFKLTEKVRLVAIISSGAVILNIILNAIFIFGMFGLKPMSTEGAAIATTISRIVELGFCIGISLKPSNIRMNLRKLFSQPKQLRKDFARHCFPLIGSSLAWGLGFTSYTAIIGHMGTNPAAACSIAGVVRDLICCVCNGVANAAGIMVGNELGAGNLEAGKAIGIRHVKISFLIGFGSTIVVLAITPLIINMVKLTDEAREYLIYMMIIMAVYMIGRCVNTVSINGVLDSGGDTIFDMYSLMVSMWMIAVPLAFFGAFVFHWSPIVVYACTCVDEVGKIPWVMIRMKKYKWVKDLTRKLDEE